MDIPNALHKFTNKPLQEATRDLFKNTLGIPISPLADTAIPPERFFRNAYKETRHSCIREIFLTAKITDESFIDVAQVNSNFDTIAAEIEQSKDYQGLFIFAVDLGNSELNRGDLATLTRDINKMFPTPVIVVFKHAANTRLVLSFGVASRRSSLKDDGSHVLGKVAMIRDVAVDNPHRGHLDLLEMFSLKKLTSEGGKPVRNFKSFHTALEQIFNVELLNKKFYRELSNWFFWAMHNCHFPFEGIESDKGGLFQENDKVREHDAKNLIRLLTRILFVWFIKEKDLVPDSFFDPEALQNELLKEFDAESTDTIYYKAILQNLFFATLNQTHGKREFRTGGQHHNTTTLLRYKDAVQEPQQFIDTVESITPFLNGGLFECLDYPHPTKKGRQGGSVIVYEDGFSDRKDNPLVVPDYLFFGQERAVDLSDDYGDNKRNKEKVRGLIHILNGYKFTIVENTPIEQEIALDPELLGQVFENLLASYNEETKTTARKQTGSFYTPRTIVDYMVDESLKAHLLQALTNGTSPASTDDAEATKHKLEELFGYNDQPNPFSEDQTDAIIRAIDNCKILDPACGSGAFPMGALQKLVYILGKLDPRDKLWEKRQLTKVDRLIEAAQDIDDSTFREGAIADAEAQKKDIEDAFSKNELGYGRKLYLIENCLYGVDIQSIATQVSKLRFFISLIVDQKVDTSRDNFGVRPLPNLESKFVTADTLIKIEKPKRQGELSELAEVSDLQKELKRVRHDLFSAKTPRTKNKHRERDKELRSAIAEELKQNGWSSDAADKLAAWDPYDQNASASYFDPEWMFGLSGFDVVIGNPPYIQIQKFPKAQKDKWVAQNYQTYAATADIYCLFYERGSQLLNPDGHLSYITSNKWMRAGYGKKLRDYLASKVDTYGVLDFGMAQNFGAATTYTCITQLAQRPSRHQLRTCYASDDKAAMQYPAAYFETNAVTQESLSELPWIILSSERQVIKNKVEAQGIPLKDWDISINYGIKTGFNDAFYLTQEQRDAFVTEDPKCADYLVPLLRGRYVSRYATNWDGTWMIATFPILKLDFDKLPAPIQRHLKQYQSRLEPKPRGWKGGKWNGRKAGSYRWFETQDTIGYHKEFLKPKIIYPNMTKFLPFYYDCVNGFYGNQKCFIITSDSNTIGHLTAFFNSTLFKCCFRDNFPELLGNTYELSKIFVDILPVKKPTKTEAELFEKLVPLVQTAKKATLDVAASSLETLIDACVMECYFHDHMAERDLLFHDSVATALSDYDPKATEADQVAYIESLQERLIEAKIPERLKRIPVESPDLLGVIIKEGQV